MKDVALESSRVASLTEKQRECLHLVVLRKSPKEIAQILNVSKPAVDQRLVSAQKALGAATPDEAALIYACASGNFDRIPHDPVAVLSLDNTGSERAQDEQPSSFMLEELPGAYRNGSTHGTSFWSQVENEPGESLRTGQRIAIITVLTIGFLAIVLIGLSVSQSLFTLLAA